VRSVILQAMGTRPDVSVAIGRVELRDRDCFILCSDGLSNELGAEDIRDIVLRARDVPSACTQLLDTANARGGEDNITAIVAGVGGDLPKRKPGETIAETVAVLRDFDPPSV